MAPVCDLHAKQTPLSRLSWPCSKAILRAATLAAEPALSAAALKPPRSCRARRRFEAAFIPASAQAHQASFKMALVGHELSRVRAFRPHRTAATVRGTVRDAAAGRRRAARPARRAHRMAHSGGNAAAAVVTATGRAPPSRALWPSMRAFESG
eukprot:364693-Chlamydomonas_euryale.AAC.4